MSLTSWLDRSEILWQFLRPLRPDAVVERPAGAGDVRKRLPAPERNAGVDHHARVASIDVAVIAHRIERRAPATVDDVDLVARIAARAHRPDHVVEVGRVDVVVDDDGPAVAIGAGVTMGRHHAGLLGVAAIELLDRYRQHEAAAAG